MLERRGAKLTATLVAAKLAGKYDSPAELQNP